VIQDLSHTPRVVHSYFHQGGENNSAPGIKFLKREKKKNNEKKKEKINKCNKKPKFF